MTNREIAVWDDMLEEILHLKRQKLALRAALFAMSSGFTPESWQLARETLAKTAEPEEQP